VQAIAKAQEIPPKFLEQILLTLKRARYVSSIKGPKGGYKLLKPADQISLAEIIRLFDGALAPTESVSKYFYEPTPVEKEKGLIKVFKEIRNQISEKLEKTSLADV
jgi:Rrf2 family protein